VLTLQQLEYLLAVDTYKQFSTAAEKCFITQPSLSAMIQKLEDELGVKIFDRSKQPIMPTEIGTDIIAQARLILQESEHLKQLVKDRMETVSGDLRLGIIPTLAPYLLPLFLKDFSENFIDLKLHITELTTENIIASLKKGTLDVGIMATPSRDSQLFEDPVFYEEFVVYAPNETSVLKKNYLLPEDIDTNRLMLLQEGHCMRAQVINLCALQKTQSALSNINYEAGSLETLKRLVEAHSGITILPHLAMLEMDEDQIQYIRFFKPPAPVREISLVTHRSLAKKRLIMVLKDAIYNNLPQSIKKIRKKKIIDI
jgi:LysR family transcriptional regulator, hydrogen peroxide-inducible genes activator